MTRLSSAVLAAVALAAAGCGSSDNGDDPVTITFKAEANGEAFSCTKAGGYDLGTGALNWQPKDLRFYVHDVRLVTSTGTEVPVTITNEDFWQNAGVALLDFETNTGTCNVGTAETNTTVRGTVPGGSYVGLKFRVGVPAAQNHLNPQASTTQPPLNNPTLFWNWTGGYKFMKIDGSIQRAAAPAAAATAAFHLGSVGCTAATPGDYTTVTCTKENVPEVSFAAFNAATQSVVLDLDTLFAGASFDANTTGSADYCMSGELPYPASADPECPAIYATIGLAFGDTAAVPQTAFRVE